LLLSLLGIMCMRSALWGCLHINLNQRIKFAACNFSGTVFYDCLV